MEHGFAAAHYIPQGFHLKRTNAWFGVGVCMHTRVCDFCCFVLFCLDRILLCDPDEPQASDHPTSAYQALE